MRIISGQYKGRRFSRKIPLNIRPTTDIVRESVFNILINLISFDDIIVADIYAGTGMLGFESISRGANTCYFFDNNFKSISIIKSIANDLKLADEKINIIKGDALKKIKTLKEENPAIQFDLIFIDPPYKSNDFNDLVTLINQNEIISKNGIIILEHSILKKTIVSKNLKIGKTKVYGGTQVDFILKY